MLISCVVFAMASGIYTVSEQDYTPSCRPL